MRDALDARGKADFVWREVDIDSDSELRQQYNDEVPVVFIAMVLTSRASSVPEVRRLSPY